MPTHLDPPSPFSVSARRRARVVPGAPGAPVETLADHTLRGVKTPTMRAVDDAELYERAQAGDAAALETLLEHYLPHLHAFVRLRLAAGVRARESSMDVVQSVCRDLLAARDRFEFRGEDRFRAWLFTSALRKIMEKQRFHRLAKRDLGREQAPLSEDEQRALHLLTPSVDAIGNETAQALAAALEALSPEHREVITLARVVGLPHRVIAEVMDRSEEAVRQLLSRAVLQLTLQLRRRGVEPGR